MNGQRFRVAIGCVSAITIAHIEARHKISGYFRVLVRVFAGMGCKGFFFWNRSLCTSGYRAPHSTSSINMRLSFVCNYEHRAINVFAFPHNWVIVA